MLRVVFLALLTLALIGCSRAAVNPQFGFAEDAGEGVSLSSDESGGWFGLSGEAVEPRAGRDRSGGARAKTAQRARLAALTDRNAADAPEVHFNVIEAARLINEYRRKNGLKPLKLQSQLTLVAKEHSRDLARTDRISHYGSDGSNPFERVRRSGYRARLAAENVATGQMSFEQVLKDWQASKGHNDNLLLKDATHMGLALVYDPKTEFKTFWTLVLGAPS